jgi:hypothetical protein
MVRFGKSTSVFFRHEGDERRDVFLRINPSAIRFSQSAKGSVSNTLGGYFREVLFSDDEQYNGMQLGGLTIEGTTGVAYRRELKEIDWIWRHHGDRKEDGSPADTYFFDLDEVGESRGVLRDAPRAFLIAIQQFAWDDSAQTPFEIRFTLRTQVLRDMYWALEGEPSGGAAALPGETTAPTGGGDISERDRANRFRDKTRRGTFSESPERGSERFESPSFVPGELNLSSTLDRLGDYSDLVLWN